MSACGFTTLTLIVPTIHRGDDLEGLLRRLEKIPTPGLVEIIIVDDASNQPVTRESCHPTDTRIHVLRLDKRQGAGLARDEGARRAMGRVLVFFDDDTRPAIHWFSSLQIYLSQGVRVGTGRPRESSENSILARQRAIFYGWRYNGLRDLDVVPFLAANNAFIERELFGSIGGFASSRASSDVRMVGRLRGRASVLYCADLEVDLTLNRGLRQLVRSTYGSGANSDLGLPEFLRVECRKLRAMSAAGRSDSPAAIVAVVFQGIRVVGYFGSRLRH
jgi:glycosyltransferase involved in cell wall biosynthesis